MIINMMCCGNVENLLFAPTRPKRLPLLFPPKIRFSINPKDPIDKKIGNPQQDKEVR